MRSSPRRRVTPVASKWFMSGSTYLRVEPEHVPRVGDGERAPLASAARIRSRASSTRLGREVDPAELHERALADERAGEAEVVGRRRRERRRRDRVEQRAARRPTSTRRRRGRARGRSPARARARGRAPRAPRCGPGRGPTARAASAIGSPADAGRSRWWSATAARSRSRAVAQRVRRRRASRRRSRRPRSHERASGVGGRARSGRRARRPVPSRRRGRGARVERRGAPARHAARRVGTTSSTSTPATVRPAPGSRSTIRSPGRDRQRCVEAEPGEAVVERAAPHVVLARTDGGGQPAASVDRRLPAARERAVEHVDVEPLARPHHRVAAVQLGRGRRRRG